MPDTSISYENVPVHNTQRHIMADWEWQIDAPVVNGVPVNLQGENFETIALIIQSRRDNGVDLLEVNQEPTENGSAITITSSSVANMRVTPEDLTAIGAGATYHYLLWYKNATKAKAFLHGNLQLIG